MLRSIKVVTGDDEMVITSSQRANRTHF